MAAVIFSARANLGLLLIARCLIALLGIWGILGWMQLLERFLLLGMVCDSWLGGDRASPALQGADPSVDGAPGLCQAAAPGKFSPGQGGSLNFGAAGGGTLHPG